MDTVFLQLEALLEPFGAAASPRGHDARWRGAGCLRVGVAGVIAGVAVWLCREARKWCGCVAPLVPWWHGLRWCRLHSSTVAWPHPMEHHAQPHKGDHRQLVEKEIGDHGKPL